jgi:hypothetical protein
MTLGLSWFRPGPYVQQWCARGTVLRCTVVLVEGGYKRGGRGGSASKSQRYWLRQVPISWRRRRAWGWSLSVVLCPLRLGDCPSFYRPRREQFTCVPHYFPTRGGVASSATELTVVLANPAPVEASWRVLCSYRSDFEGGGVVVGRPAVVVGRFEGVVNGGPVRGTVVVVAMYCPRALRQYRDVVTVLGVARQWRGWPHRIDSDGEDGSRRPDVTAWPCVVTEKAFEGVTGPPSRARRVSRTGLGGTVCHEANTGLIAQCYTVAGMTFPRESVKQCRDVILGRVRVVARVLRCQSIECPYTGAGAWTTCVQAASSEADPAEGVLSPRARRTPPEGALRPRARRTSPEGALSPRARRTSPEGAFVVPPWRAAGAIRVVIVSCVCFRFVG